MQKIVYICDRCQKEISDRYCIDIYNKSSNERVTDKSKEYCLKCVEKMIKVQEVSKEIKEKRTEKVNSEKKPENKKRLVELILEGVSDEQIKAITGCRDSSLSTAKWKAKKIQEKDKSIEERVQLVDVGKIRALSRAGWTRSAIADECKTEIEVVDAVLSAKE